ncbi:MAG TPA: ABC transporter ATP-binding protein [bacterium]|nr:ABC transporter ATP-binding protein [bacterium]
MGLGASLAPAARPGPPPAGGEDLVVNNIEVVYHDVIQVLKGVSISVPAHRIVTLLGTNGAGKTTTLRAISGLLRTEDGKVRDGTITYAGTRTDGLPPEAIVRRGIVQVLEGRRVFKHLTVEENLRVGAVAHPEAFHARRDLVYTYFSPLGRHAHRLAGYLSGGEQQMIAIGRALIALARLLLLDEPSLGLSPFLVQEIFGIIRRLRDEQGITVLLVEQNAHRALAIADYGYVMEGGKIVMEGPAAELRDNPDVKELYLGLTASGARRDYRAFKYYRRRKRWL